jgi:hypothetical protein
MEGITSSPSNLRINTQDWWKQTLLDYAHSGLWEKESRRHWRAGVDPESGKEWEPLSDGRRSLLKKTGKMLGEAEILPSASSGLEVSTTSYGSYHQTGTSKMPQRKWAGINDKHLEDISKIALDNIFKGFK